MTLVNSLFKKIHELKWSYFFIRTYCVMPSKMKYNNHSNGYKEANGSYTVNSHKHNLCVWLQWPEISVERYTTLLHGGRVVDRKSIRCSLSWQTYTTSGRIHDGVTHRSSWYTHRNKCTCIVITLHEFWPSIREDVYLKHHFTMLKARYLHLPCGVRPGS